MSPSELRRHILEFVSQNEFTDAASLAQNLGVKEIEVKRQLDILRFDNLVDFLTSMALTKEDQEYVNIALTPPGWKALELESSVSADSPRTPQGEPREKIPLSQTSTSQIKFDIFLSYSSTDHSEAELLYETIKAAGGSVFLAAKTLKAGDDFAEEIRKALWASEELWLLVSPTSLKSDWVISEWGAAWALQKRIVPILHRCRPEDLPDRIRRLHCIDFYRYTDLVKDRFQV